MTTQIAVVYHSGYGHTAIVAEAVARGAAVDGVSVNTIAIAADGSIEDAQWDILDAAHGIIFGSPTYMGSASGPFKMFMDASSKKWFVKAWKDKIAAGFTVSHSLSGDKLNTLQQLAIYAAQQGMLWVGQAESSEESAVAHQRSPESVNRIGSYLGLMAQAENDAPAVTPPSGDIKTAEMFGARVALSAQRWNK